MIVLIKFGLILSNILGTFSISNGYFVRINGYKLSGAFSILSSNLNSIRIKCAERCLQTSCLSFNYHSQTEECQLNADSPYTNTSAVQEAEGWVIYHLQKENDWELVFRAQSNDSVSPYAAWMGTLSLPTPVQDGCRLMTETFTCTTIYRHDVLNTWDSENITEVQLELYRGGSRVVHVRFDGRGSTFTNWFSIDNLMDSGWSTMSKNRTFNYFSIPGHVHRRWFINQAFGGCPGDAGWLVVVDADYSTRACPWDYRSSNRSAFLFAPGEDVTSWQSYKYEEADVLAVFIKRWL